MNPHNPLDSEELQSAFLFSFQPLDDKACLEMLNSIVVSGDHVRVLRQPQQWYARWFKAVTGETQDRMVEILTEQASLTSYLHKASEHMLAQQARTQHGVARLAVVCHDLQKKLAGVRRHIEDLDRMAASLDRRVDGLEALHVVERVGDDLRAGRFGCFPDAVALLLAVEKAAWNACAKLKNADLEHCIEKLSDAWADTIKRKRYDVVPMNAFMREVASAPVQSRDALDYLFVSRAGNPTPWGAMLLDAADAGSALTKGDADSAIALADMRYAIPVIELVRMAFNEAAARLEPLVWVQDSSQQPIDHSVPVQQPIDHSIPVKGNRSPVTTAPSDVRSDRPAAPDTKLGLVLSGGGAKGAYLAGVLRAMAQHGIQPLAVAGTSIGALSAAIVAGSRNVGEAADTMEEVWRDLSRQSPLVLNTSGISMMLGLAFARLVAARVSPERGVIARHVLAAAERWAEEHGLAASVLSAEPIEKIMRERLDFSRTAEWLPFWVGAFRGTAMGSAWEWIKGQVLRLPTRGSEFFKIQDLDPEDVPTVLMASAALPVIYPRQTLGNDVFFDGGCGGAARQQGNTPITPLIQHGCTACIVTHLSNGSLWSRHDHAGPQVLEVRASDTFSGMLDFSGDAIHRLMEMGRTDADRAFRDAENSMRLRRAAQSASQKMEAALKGFG
jgi:NTE family protein